MIRFSQKARTERQATVVQCQGPADGSEVAALCKHSQDALRTLTTSRPLTFINVSRTRHKDKLCCRRENTAVPGLNVDTHLNVSVVLTLTIVSSQVGTFEMGILQMRYPVWPRFGSYLQPVSDYRHLTVATLEERPFVIVEAVDPLTGTCVSNTVPCRRQSNKTET